MTHARIAAIALGLALAAVAVPLGDAGPVGTAQAEACLIADPIAVDPGDPGGSVGSVNPRPLAFVECQLDRCELTDGDDPREVLGDPGSQLFCTA